MPSGASAQTRFLHGCSGVLGWRAPDCWRRNAARFPALQCTPHPSGPWVAVKMTASVASGSPSANENSVYPAKLGRSSRCSAGAAMCVRGGGSMFGPVCIAQGRREEQKREGIPPSSLSAAPALRHKLQRVPVRERRRGFRALLAAAFAHADETLRDDPYNLWTILCTIDIALPQEVRCAASP